MATSLIGVFLGILFGWNLTNTAKELGKPEQGAKEKRAPQKQGTLRGVLLHFWTSNSSETFATDKRHWSCFVCVLLCVFFYHEINCWVFKVEPSRWLSSNKNHDYFRINVFRPSDHPHVSCWRPSRSLHRPPESTWKDFQKLHVSLKNDFPFSGEAFFTSLEEFWAISCDRWRCKFEESSDSCEVKTLPFDSSKVCSPSHIPHHPTQCVCVCVNPDAWSPSHWNFTSCFSISLKYSWCPSHWLNNSQVVRVDLPGGLLQPIWKNMPYVKLDHENPRIGMKIILQKCVKTLW